MESYQVRIIFTINFIWPYITPDNYGSINFLDYFDIEIESLNPEFLTVRGSIFLYANIDDITYPKAAIITALNITNEYLKSLSNSQAKSADSPSLDNLTKEVKSQLKSLSL